MTNQWPIRRLWPEDIPRLAALDFEIESSWTLAVERQAEGLAVIWRLTPRPLEVPFRSTDFAPRSEEWAALVQNLITGQRLGFVAEAAEGPVAFIELEEEAWRQVAFVWNLLVHRPYRRQGIGSALLEAAIAWGRERSLRALALETQTYNWAALNFYHRKGFVLGGIDDHFYTNTDLERGEVAVFWYYHLETDGVG